jgi:hypothetical protein
MLFDPPHAISSLLDPSLCSALRTITHPPTTRSEVHLFLSNRDPTKSNEIRLLSWLISFNLIPPTPSKWAHSLTLLCADYLTFRASLEPIDSLLNTVGRVIKVDTSRSILWFTEMSRDSIFSGFSPENGELFANRILITLQHKSFHYVQGYDRYVFITLLLALDFCRKTELSSDVAEAISFNLSREFIKLTEISTFLEHPGETQSYFERMDEALLSFAPAWVNLLRKSHQGAIHFALRWELLLFADEYPVRELLLLWDNVIKWKMEFRRFRRALAIAHVRQIPLPKAGEMAIEVIQNYREWDVGRVIDEAVRIMEAEPNWSGWKWWIVMGVILMLVILRMLWR